MTHTNCGQIFVSTEMLAVEDLDLETETRSVWLSITDAPSLMARFAKSRIRDIIYRLRKREHRSDPLELLARLIVNLARCGVPESTVRLLIIYLDDVISRCYTGKALRPLTEIDRDEQAIDGRENELTLRRYLEQTLTADELVEEAEINERKAAVHLERAKVLRRQARRTPVAA